MIKVTTQVDGDAPVEYRGDHGLVITVNRDPNSQDGGAYVEFLGTMSITDMIVLTRLCIEHTNRTARTAGVHGFNVLDVLMLDEFDVHPDGDVVTH